MVAQNRDQEAPLKSNVTLRCKTENTNVSVKWYRESVPLPVSAKINGEYLHIYDLRQQDGGRYFCEVSGPQGASTDYINLNVVGKFYNQAVVILMWK